MTKPGMFESSSEALVTIGFGLAIVTLVLTLVYLVIRVAQSLW